MSRIRHYFSSIVSTPPFFQTPLSGPKSHLDLLLSQDFHWITLSSPHLPASLRFRAGLSGRVSPWEPAAGEGGIEIVIE